MFYHTSYPDILTVENLCAKLVMRNEKGGLMVKVPPGHFISSRTNSGQERHLSIGSECIIFAPISKIHHVHLQHYASNSDLDVFTVTLLP